jgi:hypothetical protein
VLDEETCLHADCWQAGGLPLRRGVMGACTACGAGERQCLWHQCLDHLADGKPPEAFFARLTASLTRRKQSA